MLRTKDGVTEVSGTKIEVKVDLTLLLKVLRDEEVLTDADIDECVVQSRKSVDALDEEVSEKLQKLIDAGELTSFIAWIIANKKRK